MKNSKITLSFIAVICLFISCDDEIGPPLERELTLEYGILDYENLWGTFSVSDTILTSRLDSTLAYEPNAMMIEIIEDFISDPEGVELINRRRNDDTNTIPRTLSIQTKYDHETLIAGENMLEAYKATGGPSLYNGIEHHYSSIGILIPIRIGSQVVPGNDTLELVSDEIYFMQTFYTSPLSGLEKDILMYLKNDNN